MKAEIIVLRSMNLEEPEFVFEKIQVYRQEEVEFIRLSYDDNLLM